MAGDDEYELLPKEEVDMLKKEIERLKKHPFGELPEGENILDAINNLNANIKKLIDIFTKAQADLADEYSKSNPSEDISTIKDQNEQIAQGMLTVAGMVKDLKDSQEQAPLRSEPRIPMYHPGRPMPSSEGGPPDFPVQMPQPPPLGPGAEGPPPPFEEHFPRMEKKHKRFLGRR